MVNGSGICGFMPGIHCQSGDSAFHRCTCASTIMRLRAACGEGACAFASCEPASPAPAPSAPVRKLRRDCMLRPSRFVILVVMSRSLEPVPHIPFFGRGGFQTCPYQAAETVSGNRLLAV